MKKNIIHIITLLIYFAANAQEKVNDTLFFKFDSRYVYDALSGFEAYILKDSGYDGTFYFEKEGIYVGLNPEKVLNLKKFVRTSKFYNRKRHRKLNDYRLYEYFRDYTIFLVKGNEFIKVTSGHEVE